MIYNKPACRSFVGTVHTSLTYRQVYISKHSQPYSRWWPHHTLFTSWHPSSSAWCMRKHSRAPDLFLTVGLSTVSMTSNRVIFRLAIIVWNLYNGQCNVIDSVNGKRMPSTIPPIVSSSQNRITSTAWKSISYVAADQIHRQNSTALQRISSSPSL